MQLEWKIPSLVRSGASSLAGLLLRSKREEKRAVASLPFISKLPIRMHLSVSGAAESSGASTFQARVGNTLGVRLSVDNLGHGPVKDIYPTIVVAKRVGTRYELINGKRFDLPVSGELRGYFPEVAPKSAGKHEVELIFVERNNYMIGAVCELAGDIDFYVCGQAITLEII